MSGCSDFLFRPLEPISNAILIADRNSCSGSRSPPRVLVRLHPWRRAGFPLAMALWKHSYFPRTLRRSCADDAAGSEPRER